VDFGSCSELQKSCSEHETPSSEVQNPCSEDDESCSEVQKSSSEQEKSCSEHEESCSVGSHSGEQKGGRKHESPKIRKVSLEPERVERGLDNLSSDYRFADAEVQSLKTKLAAKITGLIEQKGWIQT